MVIAMEYLWYLLCYSFLGFCAEVIYSRMVGTVKRDRKCHFFLPLCPVYGAGGTAIAALPPAVTNCLPLLFLASVLVASGTEYVFSFFYETVWNVSFWDYSGLPGNLHGRVCPLFSLIWGLMGVVLVRFIHPRVSVLVAVLPTTLFLPALLLFLADFSLTTILLRRNGSTDALIWYR